MPPFVKGQRANPNGGPMKRLTHQQLAQITKLAARGVREADIMRACNCSSWVWPRIKERQPELQTAIDAGRQQMHDALVGKLFELAMRGEVVPNLFLLKTRFGYREGDPSEEQRPQIVINLPSGTTLDTYKRPQRALPTTIDHDDADA